MNTLQGLVYIFGRSPQGGCGLKWFCPCVPFSIRTCRSPQGECGLKFNDVGVTALWNSRSPQGECGLKS